MGVDVRIYVTAREGATTDLPPSVEMIPIRSGNFMVQFGATHEISNPWRFYGPGYERGPWPEIAGVLMRLLADPDIETVWYQGDCDNTPHLFVPSRLHALTNHYLRVRHEPYCSAFR